MEDSLKTASTVPTYYDSFIAAVQKDIELTREYGSAGLPVVASLRQLQLDALRLMGEEFRDLEDDDGE